jgi:hypothetical protein
MSAPDGFQPALILRDDWALWSYSQQQANEFYELRPLLGGIEPEDAGRPLAKVAYLNLGGILAAIRPWLPVVMAQLNREEGGTAWAYRVPGPLDWTVTLEDLLEWWTVLESAGEMVSTTRVDDQGRATVRSIYRE